MTYRYDSPLGPMELTLNDDGALERLSWNCLGEDISPADNEVTRCYGFLDAYFAGIAVEPSIPVALKGTPFQMAVWEALAGIPRGETRSYSEIARAIGRPKAVRAVARACHLNPVAILIPCHRVIGADGSLTGYAGGLEVKRGLLAIEGVDLD